MTRALQRVGDTFADVLIWCWDRTNMQYEAKHEGARLRAQFHKIGGRYSKATGRSSQSYWTIELTPTGQYSERSLTHYATADEAKVAVAARYRDHLRAMAAIKQGRTP